MSHFVRIRTQLRERTFLLAALRDLGCTVEEGRDLPVRGDQPIPERAEIIARYGSPDSAVEIGFRQVGDHFEIVADWFHIQMRSKVRREFFLANLNRRYAYHVVRDQAREQNLVVEEETLPNGDIVLTLSERG